MYGTDVIVRDTFDVGFLTNGGNDDEKPKSLLGQIADNTQETVEILKTAVLGPPGTASEERDESISKGETDEPKGGRFGRALTGIGSALDKVNPFSSGFAFGNIGRVLLAGGGLLLLKLFGENLIGPLANLLETIKTGKIGEKLTELKNDVKEKLEPIIVEMKEAFTAFIAGAKRVVEIIKSVYKMVDEYIMQFDTGGKVIDLTQYGMGGGVPGGRVEIGDGKLDAAEQLALKEDLAEKAKKAIGGFLQMVFDSFIGLMLTSTFAIFGAKQLLKSAAIQGIFFGGTGSKPPQGPTRKGTPLKGKGIGVGGALGIAALLLFGVTETFDNFRESMEKSLADTGGTFDFSDFISKFLGGEKEGGFINAFAQAKKSAGTGALVGMSLGAFGGLPGIVFGGVLGLAAGALIGGLSGYAGSDKMKEITDQFLKVVNNITTSIGNFFTDVAAGFGSMLRGEGFMKGFKERTSANVGGVLNKELENINREIEQLQNLQKMFPDLDLSEDIKELEKKAQVVDKRLAFAPAVAEGMALQDLKDEEKKYITKIKGIEDTVEAVANNRFDAKVLLYPVVDENFEKMGLPKTITAAEALPVYKEILKQIQSQISIAEGNFTKKDEEMVDAANRIGSGSEMTEAYNFGGTSGTSFDFIPQFDRHTLASIISAAGSNRQPGIIQANNNSTNSNNTAVTNQNLGGMTVGNQDYATEVMVKGIQ